MKVSWHISPAFLYVLPVPSPPLCPLPPPPTPPCVPCPLPRCVPCLLPRSPAVALAVSHARRAGDGGRKGPISVVFFTEPARRGRSKSARDGTAVFSFVRSFRRSDRRIGWLGHSVGAGSNKWVVHQSTATWSLLQAGYLGARQGVRSFARSGVQTNGMDGWVPRLCWIQVHSLSSTIQGGHSNQHQIWFVTIV